MNEENKFEITGDVKCYRELQVTVHYPKEIKAPFLTKLQFLEENGFLIKIKED